MSENDTIKEITTKVEKASTDFEKTNTEIKRKYLIWNIETFNTIASKVKSYKGTFGTGYPFYVLDKNLEGKIPIIQEQIRYNRELVRNGEPFQKSIWQCKPCLKESYARMPDLKKFCIPCPNMVDQLKPRKIINRLPDLDMWLVCEDGKVEESQEELAFFLDKFNMHTSDKNPLSTIDEVKKISEMLKQGKIPDIYLPIDTHIIEYSTIKELIEKTPEELNSSEREERKPYLPIYPKSYRKQWQYDDEAYNFIYDYLSAFTPFNFPKELQDSLEMSRSQVVSKHTKEELLNFLMQSATKANFRRFQSLELEEYFFNKIEDWKKIKENKNISGGERDDIYQDDELEL